MGDFVDGSSDYDFLAVVEGDLPRDDLDAIADLHRQLRETYLDADRLEGDYAPRYLLCPDGTTAPIAGVQRGCLESQVAEIMLSAENIANMRSQGVAVYGPPASEILPVATPKHVRDAVRQVLLDGADDCATELEAAAELLNLARSLRALETGQPTTKSDGAEWALGHLEEQWQGVFHRALAVRHGATADEGVRPLRDALPSFGRLAQSIARRL